MRSFGGEFRCKVSWGGQKLAHRVPTEQQGTSMTIGKPFKKGQSGNPGGRPKVIAEVKELARAHTGEAIETLVSIMTNPSLHLRRESLLQTHYLIEVMASLPSTSLVRVGLSYVVRLPEPCKTVEEWVASLGDRSSPTPSNGSAVSAT